MSKDFDSSWLMRFQAREMVRKTNDNPLRSKIPDPIVERDQAPALGSATKGKAKVLERVRVRFVGYRVRPLDPDNFAGSCKDGLDFLRHANLIKGDEPWRITLETEQVQVAHFHQEKTVIEIELP